MLHYKNIEVNAIQGEAVKFIKDCKGLIRGQCGTDSLVWLTHVGVYLESPESKNPILVGLSEGCIAPVNLLHINMYEGCLDNVILSNTSVCGIFDTTERSLSTVVEEYNTTQTGQFIEVIELVPSTSTLV